MQEKPKILVVDDEEIVRLNIERILTSVGYAVVTAKDGRDAVPLISKDEFDLVLTDLIMEDVDGFAILEEVKRVSPETIVIIVTGYGSLASAVKAMQKGAFDYILKPCEREEMIFRVKKGIEKKEMEERLLKFKRMETVLSNIGVFTLDGSGFITSGKSAISKRLWGTEDIVGRDIRQLPGVAESGLVACFEQALSGQDIDKENVRFYTQNRGHKEFILSVHFKPVNSQNGRVNSLMWIVEDLTRRTQVMQQIGQAEKLAALGKLAAGVAHEINNPLNIISLDVEFIKSQIEPTSGITESLRSINEEVDRIAHIVRQLQNHAKTDEGIQESLDINELLNSHIFNITFSQLAKSGIKVNLDPAAHLPHVFIPKTKLTQVFMNIIKNAEDAMSKGGALTITTRRAVPLRSVYGTEVTKKFMSRDFVEIVIADTGVGIKKEDMNYLFEPFFTTKGFDGTGLGLFISYSIIKSYNGIIKVESHENKGTAFSIILPAA